MCKGPSAGTEGSALLFLRSHVSRPRFWRSTAGLLILFSHLMDVFGVLFLLQWPGSRLLTRSEMEKFYRFHLAIEKALGKVCQDIIPAENSRECARKILVLKGLSHFAKQEIFHSNLHCPRSANFLRRVIIKRVQDFEKNLFCPSGWGRAGPANSHSWSERLMDERC